MRIYFFCLSILITSLSSGAESVLTWTAPTFNEDGTTLTDLASYEIWHGCTTSGAYDTVEVVLVPALTHTVIGLPDVGTCYFAAKATNSQGQSSVFSGEATEVFSNVVLPGLVTDTAITWQESPPVTSIYELPITDFSGTPIFAGNFSVPGQSLVIDFTMNPRSFPQGDERIISKAVSFFEQGHFFMVSMTNGRLRFRLKSSGTTSTLYGNAAIPLNVQTVGRVEYDGANMSIYVNDSLDAQMSKTGNMDISSAEVWVGGNPPDNYAPFDGLISVTVN